MPAEPATASQSQSDRQMLPIYGGYELRRGDRDSDIFNNGAPRWNGQDGAGPYDALDPIEHPFEVLVRLNATSTITIPSYVQELQMDLRALGFSVIREETGQFDLYTEWAVREFQIYAGMERVAQEAFPPPEGTTYLERLSGAENTMRYHGPISGVANRETRERIKHWLREGWRCPVVIQARTGAGFADIYDGSSMAEGADPENLWRHDDLRSNNPRVFARDFTGYYDFEGTGHDPDEMILVGDYYPRNLEHYSWGGQRVYERSGHCWDSAEVTPQLLTGNDNLAGAQEATFNVVHAIAEIECQGYLDGLNAYDRALISAGLIHWTLGLCDNGYVGVGDLDTEIAEGELCAFLAYLRHADEHAYDQTFSNFGVRIDKEWGRDGGDLESPAERKYTAWIEQQQEDGAYEAMPRGREGRASDIREAIDEALYFRSWHWFYRFVMSSRTIEGFQRATWDFTRIRLRDVLDTPFETPNWSRWQGEQTIGSIFTSEKTVAILLRWHVYTPALVVNSEGARRRVTDALENARRATPQLRWGRDPVNWNDDQEAALRQGLIDSIGTISLSNLRETVRRVNEEDDGVSLSESRNSFELDRSGLPPAP